MLNNQKIRPMKKSVLVVILWVVASAMAIAQSGIKFVPQAVKNTSCNSAAIQLANDYKKEFKLQSEVDGEIYLKVTTTKNSCVKLKVFDSKNNLILSEIYTAIGSYKIAFESIEREQYRVVYEVEEPSKLQLYCQTESIKLI